MKKWICYCDVCGKERQEGELYHIKTRSLKNVNYANYDSLFADKKTIDICEFCVRDFQEYLKVKKENRHLWY